MRTAQAFCDAMFADAPRGTATVITAFLCEPNHAGRNEWRGIAWYPGKKVPVWFDGANAYVTVSTFVQDVATGNARRRKADWSAMHAVMIDDVGTKVAAEKLLLKPSALIETSPGNFQAYLFLRSEDPARKDQATCALLVQRMIEAGLTADAKDPGMKGVTRYGRLPCGINNKPKYGKPFSVQLVQWDYALRYSMGEIATAYGLDLTPPAPKGELALPGDEAERDERVRRFESLLAVIASIGKYQTKNSAGWHEIDCPWVMHHTGRSVTGTALIPPSAENKFMGGFKCHHGHCEQKTMQDVWQLFEAAAETTRLRWPWSGS